MIAPKVLDIQDACSGLIKLANNVSIRAVRLLLLRCPKAPQIIDNVLVYVLKGFPELKFSFSNRKCSTMNVNSNGYMEGEHSCQFSSESTVQKLRDFNIVLILGESSRPSCPRPRCLGFCLVYTKSLASALPCAHVSSC